MSYLLNAKADIPNETPRFTGKFIGDKSLQNAIDGLIKANHAKITPEEAEVIFGTEWNKVENEML